MEGEAGHFVARVRKQPRYVDVKLCKACGTCTAYCPSPVRDHYNEGLSLTKAIHIDYAQGIPSAYHIDDTACLFLTKKECKQCERVCLVKAIDFRQAPEEIRLEVGAILLAPGFDRVHETVLSRYGYGIRPNVVTSRELERMLSASGPHGGHLARPSDGKEPKRIAWIQCVGSRDLHPKANSYCSTVCCTYAIKQAVIAKEHCGASLDTAIYYIDIRTCGKDFERYFARARDKLGVRFVKSRIIHIPEQGETGNLLIRYTDERGNRAEEPFDMVVLSVGMQTPPDAVELARSLGVRLSPGRFCETESFNPMATTREGIYVAGAFRGPTDIPQAVIEASAAAAVAAAPLTSARDTLTATRETPPKAGTPLKRPCVGVFVCHCGVNIASVVDVQAVCEYAKTLPFVKLVRNDLYSCSQDAQEAIGQIIQENGLNRIVVAACTPKTHEPLFQETLTNAGLNKYLLEMVNIRNQDAWVHKDDPGKATEKAKDLVRMAVAKAAFLSALKEAQVDIHQSALVVGGGIAGMAAAKALSAHGYQVHLVEMSHFLGGRARSLYHTWKGEDVQKNLHGLIRSVEMDRNIQVHLNARPRDVEGFVGQFRTTLSAGDEARTIDHGVAVIATGGMELRPEEYLYGQDPRVMTHLELDQRFISRDSSLAGIQTAVFIQCVGSREPERPYCSRVCCTHTMESALHLKEINPRMAVYVFYRDIRTYGEREAVFRKAREAGVSFLPYSPERKPQAKVVGKRLTLEVFDVFLSRTIGLDTDLLVLASAILPNRDEDLARLFKIAVNEDGFYLEAHAKLRPSEFATDGVYLCGLSHSPKSIDESVAQAQAAASRAMTLLSKKSVWLSGAVAYVKPDFCTGCGVCLEICPFSATSFATRGSLEGVADINPVLCKGCGLCVASCRSGALELKGFETVQIMAMINEM